MTVLLVLFAVALTPLLPRPTPGTVVIKRRRRTF